MRDPGRPLSARAREPSLAPDLLPCAELGGCDPVAGTVAGVQAQEFPLCNLAKPLAVRRFDLSDRPFAHMGARPTLAEEHDGITIPEFDGFAAGLIVSPEPIPATE